MKTAPIADDKPSRGSQELEEGAAGGAPPDRAMTAHAMKGDREICLAAGRDAYVAKAIIPRELLAALQDVAPMPAQGPAASSGLLQGAEKFP
jgi:CheY-like chemotaxis protein